jgi:hypothetical protein
MSRRAALVMTLQVAMVVLVVMASAVVVSHEIREPALQSYSDECRWLRIAAVLPTLPWTHCDRIATISLAVPCIRVISDGCQQGSRNVGGCSQDRPLAATEGSRRFK